jgi:PPOX class probable F420-dependent enzyme
MDTTTRAPETPRTGRFDRFAKQWAIQLVSFRRNGKPVETPVNIAVDQGRAFFRTFEESGKFKRLRRNPFVRIRPSTWLGRPTGPAEDARAELLDGDAAERAAALIDAKHPLFQRVLVRLGHRLRGLHTRHFELVLR